MTPLMRLVDLVAMSARTPTEIATLKTALARIHLADLKSRDDFNDPREAEFRAFSQFGEDGILLYILTRTTLAPQRFVEFGIEDYREASTRLLAELGGWSGLVMDASQRNIRRLRRSPTMWRSPLTAKASFITAENINELLASPGFDRNVGVMVIDIDGNEFWIWKALDQCRPAVMVVEYNALWGLDRPVTIPYSPRFSRFAAHSSGVYAGASLPALQVVAKATGYRLVAVNTQANNAFFVHEDSGCTLPSLEIADWMDRPGFQQSRDRRGRLTFEGDSEAVREVLHLPLVDVVTGDRILVRDVAETTDRSHGET